MRAVSAMTVLIVMFGVLILAERDWKHTQEQRKASQEALQSTIALQADSIHTLRDSLAYFEPHRARVNDLNNRLDHCHATIRHNWGEVMRVRP